MLRTSPTILTRSIHSSLPRQSAQPFTQFQGLERWFNRLFSNLSGSREPSIAKRSNRYGETYWRVFDPTTNQIHTFGSDTEVRAWLDQRYYH